MEGPTELRVHGVSGTTPQSLLSRDGDAKVSRVASYTDRLTGFYRVHGAADPPVEAYSWGALTSGSGQVIERLRRVGWLSLLPFALANVAYWSRPDIEGTQSPTRRATAIAVRWGALLLTMMFIGTFCLIAMDLLAWQCFRGGGLSCDLPGLPLLDRVEILATPMFNAPARRLLLGAVVPLLALLALLALSHQAVQRYESVPDEGVPGYRPTAGLDGGQPILRRERMWQGGVRVRRQTRLHVAAGLSVIVLYGTLPLVSEAGSDTNRWTAWLAVAAATAALLLAFAASWLSAAEGTDFYGPPARSSLRLHRPAFVAALVAVGAMVVANGFVLADLPLDEARNIRGDNLFFGLPLVCLGAIVAFLVFAGRSVLLGIVGVGVYAAVVVLGFVPVWSDEPLVSAALALLLAMVAVALLEWLHRSRPSEGEAWHGAAPAVLMGAATWVALVFSVVAAVGTAEVLNGSAPVTDLEAAYDETRSVAAPLLERPRDLRAPGAVLVGGAVEADGAGLTVRSGVLEVDRLEVATAAGTARAIPGLTIREAQLAIDGPLRLRNSSCLASDPLNPCPAGAEFVVAGSIALPDDTGIAIRVPDGLQVLVAERPQEILVLPSVLLWMATMLPLWMAAAMILLAVSWTRFSRRTAPAVRQQIIADGIAEADRDRCEGPRIRAAYLHTAETQIGRLALLTAVAALLCAIGAATSQAPWERFERVRLLGDVGLYLAIILGGALMWFASKVRTSQDSRRQAGVLWDIATFWPRVAHPFGPPCYGERVVPELRRRLTEAAADPVIVSAHSQGSVIAVAVLARLTPAELQRVRLITYGSQLRAWFGRLFPAVLGPPVLAGLRNEVKWVNLYRRTDPIGFPVFAPGDPSDLLVLEVDDRHDVQTHGGYQFSPEYQRQVEQMSN